MVTVMIRPASRWEAHDMSAPGRDPGRPAMRALIEIERVRAPGDLVGTLGHETCSELTLTARSLRGLRRSTIAATVRDVRSRAIAGKKYDYEHANNYQVR